MGLIMNAREDLGGVEEVCDPILPYSPVTHSFEEDTREFTIVNWLIGKSVNHSNWRLNHLSRKLRRGILALKHSLRLKGYLDA
jgi:hypothetical protein